MSRRSASIVVLFILVGVGAYASPTVFRFHPPDSISFTVEVKTDRTRWIDSTKQPTDSSISVIRRTIRKSGSGYVMTAQPISVVTTIDGKPADNPINKMLTGIRSTSVLDTLGMISSVKGFEGVPTKIDSLFTGEIAQKLKTSLSPENMAAREQLEWNGKLQGLAGARIDVDSIAYEVSQYPLPGGSHIPFLLAVRVADTVTLNKKFCAILLISAGSDPVELTQRLHVRSDEVALHYPMRDAAGMAIIKAGSKYYSETRVVLEVATMLIQSESSQREMTVVGEPGPGPRKLRFSDGETRRYNYSK